jgi:hypothetical protein
MAIRKRALLACVGGREGLAFAERTGRLLREVAAEIEGSSLESTLAIKDAMGRHAGNLAKVARLIGRHTGLVVEDVIDTLAEPAMQCGFMTRRQVEAAIRREFATGRQEACQAR